MRPIPSARSSRLLAPLLLVSIALAQGSVEDDGETPESPLVKLFKRATEERKGTIAETLGKRGTASDLDYLFGQVALKEEAPKPLRLKAIEALTDAATTRKVSPKLDPTGLAAVIRPAPPLAADPALQPAAIRLAGAWKAGGLGHVVAQVAEDGKSTDPARAAAFEALAEIGGEAGKARLGSLAKSPGRPIDLRALAVASLAKLDVDAAAEAAVDILKHAAPGQDLAPMLAGFLNRQDGPDKLAAAVAGGHIPADPAKLALRAMYALGRADPKLVEILSKVAGISADVRPPGKAEVDRLMAEVAASGNAARGEQVFRRADLNCLKCHAVAGAAGGVGPELSSVGASSPVDYLINSIMVPDQAIKEEFVTKVVQTADGRVYHGIVVDKDDKRVVLREATGEKRTIPADEIEESKDGGSLMPKGLVNFMTRAEFVDLLRFLSELGKPGPYAIHSTSAPTIQRWRLLHPVAADLLKAVPAPEAFRKEVWEAGPNRWLPAYASVTGSLDLAELTAIARGPVLYLQAEVSVTSDGPVGFRLDQPAGLDIWADGRPIAAGPAFTTDLAAGLHKLTFRVDTGARRGAPLKVEVAKPEGSSAEFTVVGGR